MKAKEYLLRGLVTLVAVAMVLVLVSVVLGVSTPPGPPARGGSDLILIENLGIYGELQRGPVPFPHQKHTKALAAEGGGCRTCHLPDPVGGRLLTRFKSLAARGLDQDRAVFHDNCLGCHNQRRARDRKSGPVECGQCHQFRPGAAGAWKRLDFDKSLHYRHIQSQKNDCGKCHHQYDPKTRKLAWAKGKEGSCRYCHGPRDQVRLVGGRRQRVISMKEAAHLSCLDCHRRTIQAKGKAGPLECAGCHSAAGQAKIKKLKKVPRLKRNQPQVVLIRALPAGPSPGPGQAPPAMNPVPFDHEAHESYTATCRSCHHQDLASCTKKCHTPGGDKRGGFVTLSQAMHDPRSRRSCLGCHRRRQERDRNCAGCHQGARFRPAAQKDLCQRCHLRPPEGLLPAKGKDLAAALLARRQAAGLLYPEQDIPEVVEIKHLEKDYQPVKLPHRRIVKKLVRGMEASKLAGYQHRGPATVCQGCHHNSPPAKKPPACASCHGRRASPGNLSMPVLKAAYHQQCMGCHRRMGLSKPVAVACAQCHQKKNQQAKAR